MTPRIAIPLPTSTDIAYNLRSWPLYAAAITRSGGQPVAIDLALPPAEIARLAATCHGLLLPGSPADVDPPLYGAPRLPECGPADPAREAADRILLDDAEKSAKPVLGICYGIQSLNVWRGGSLLQDLAPLPVNHEAGSKVAIAHTILIAPDSLLASLADPAELTTSPSDPAGLLRLPINTSHHQSVAAPGDGLRITARCPDDAVIEALELDPSFPPSSTPTSEMFHVEHSSTPQPPRPWFLLAVQWHPERSFDISPTSRNLFTRLISEAKLTTAEAQPLTTNH